MNRRNFFATVAAAIAGRKLLPATPRIVVGVDDASPASDYTVVRYTGCSFKVSREMLEDDPYSRFFPGKVFPLDDEVAHIVRHAFQACPSSPTPTPADPLPSST